ncbi:hypothetical protein QR680_015135 [Steinernema hermaphroditum]|uniref:WW domain-containing protein n=1 Tax=Steinernema hermaphroditum TaxID=289476 RepID=A0AA39M4E4_9BILA|nr:hypothetical protein QR680_015135 [Steinernema hermaphroditum]
MASTSAESSTSQENAAKGGGRRTGKEVYVPGIPQPWKACWSEHSGCLFFFNTKTGESLWQREFDERVMAPIYGWGNPSSLQPPPTPYVPMRHQMPIQPPVMPRRGLLPAPNGAYNGPSCSVPPFFEHHQQEVQRAYVVGQNYVPRNKFGVPLPMKRNKKKKRCKSEQKAEAPKKKQESSVSCEAPVCSNETTSIPSAESASTACKCNREKENAGGTENKVIAKSPRKVKSVSPLKNVGRKRDSVASRSQSLEPVKSELNRKPVSFKIPKKLAAVGESPLKATETAERKCEDDGVIVINDVNEKAVNSEQKEKRDEHHKTEPTAATQPRLANVVLTSNEKPHSQQADIPPFPAKVVAQTTLTTECHSTSQINKTVPNMQQNTATTDVPQTPAVALVINAQPEAEKIANAYELNDAELLELSDEEAEEYDEPMDVDFDIGDFDISPDVDMEDQHELAPKKDLKCIVVFDTCSLLDNPHVMEDCVIRGVNVVIPRKVLDELDHQKTVNRNVARMSQEVHRVALDLQPTKMVIVEQREEMRSYLTPGLKNDDIIVECAKNLRDEVVRTYGDGQVDVFFVTSDCNCSLRAAAYDLKCLNSDEFLKLLKLNYPLTTTPEKQPQTNAVFR